MEKLYLVLLHSAYSRNKILKYLEEEEIAIDWFYNHPFSFFIKTTVEPKDLVEIIEERFGKRSIYVQEVGLNYWGRIPKEHWDRFERRTM